MSLNVNADSLKLKPENAEIVVNGILQGNKKYANMRISESQYLIVSSGLSWSRGNYIDSGVYHEYEDAKNHDFSNRIVTAGYAWKYLQFNVENRALIVIKPERGQESKFHSTTENAFSNTSLQKLAEVNRKFFNETDTGVEFSKQTELALEPQFNEVMQQISEGKNIEFEQFFIVTYTVEEQNVSSVKMYMPNPYSQGFQLIDDLTKYIDFTNNEYQLTEEEVGKINQDPEIPDATYYSVAVEEGETEQTQ